MELLYSRSFMTCSNYFLSNLRSLRIYGVISFCAPNRSDHINLRKFFARWKTSSAVENDDPLMYFIRPYSSNSIFDKLKYHLGNFKRGENRAIMALRLYKSLDSLNFQEFYTFLEMPDTFYSWYLLMELHLWMLLSQLMDKEKEGIKLRKTLVQMFWYDVESRIDCLKLNTPKIIKKQLTELSGRLPIAFLVYDEGLLSTDLVLSGGLWYIFFEKQEVDPRKIEVLVKYIRYQVLLTRQSSLGLLQFEMCPSDELMALCLIFQVQHLSLLNLKDYSEAQKITNFWLPFAPHLNAVMSEN